MNKPKDPSTTESGVESTVHVTETLNTNKSKSKKSKVTNEELADPVLIVDTSPKETLDKELLRVLMEVKNGNFNVRMPVDQVGVGGKICDTLNEIIELNQKMTQEFTLASNTIG